MASNSPGSLPNPEEPLSPEILALFEVDRGLELVGSLTGSGQPLTRGYSVRGLAELEDYVRANGGEFQPLSDGILLALSFAGVDPRAKLTAVLALIAGSGTVAAVPSYGSYHLGRLRDFLRAERFDAGVEL